MKDISFYFSPVTSILNPTEEQLSDKIMVHTENNFPEIKKNGIAFFFCPEYRNSKQVPDKVQQEFNLTEFYHLYSGDQWNFPIYDLGVLLPGNTITDTYFALSQVVSELIKQNIVPIIIGGGQDLTYAVYQGFQQLEQMLNLTLIDSKFDLGNPENEINEDAFITPILMSRPCFLFNCSNIGIQAPYVKKSELDLYEKLYFDVCRLGEFNADFKRAEPYLRNTDFLSIDLNSIRNADFNTFTNNPNGFYADQICQIAKYAGISDKLSCLGLFNLHHNTKINKQLIAEVLWYFIDGYAQRKGDFPVGTKKDYLKFNVHLEAHENDLVFYKSPKSDRWWLEVPYPSQKGVKYERHYLVPCSYEDYLAAMNNEIPDLWWKTYQKLS
jgi:formiminoglutamase